MLFVTENDANANTIDQRRESNMNTKISYLYRDAGNYKQFHEVVVEGEIADEQKSKIIDNLESGEFFVPDCLGWPWGMDGYGTDDQSDHPFCELGEDGFELTDDAPTEEQDIDTVANIFRECGEQGWENTEGYRERMSEIVEF